MPECPVCGSGGLSHKVSAFVVACLFVAIALTVVAGAVALVKVAL